MGIRDRMRNQMGAIGGRQQTAQFWPVVVPIPNFYSHPELQNWLIHRVATSPRDSWERTEHREAMSFVPLDRRDRNILYAMRAGDTDAALHWVNSWPRRVCKHTNKVIVGTERREPYVTETGRVEFRRTGDYDWWYEGTGSTWYYPATESGRKELPLKHRPVPSSHERDPLVRA